jgi:hypothetical protein
MTVELRAEDRKRLHNLAQIEGTSSEEYATALLQYCLRGFDRLELQAMVADSRSVAWDWRGPFEHGKNRE